MKYKIYCGELLIAQFKNEYDRDICLDTLKEIFDDVELTKELKKCWKCGIDEVYEIDDNNGLCYNCYAQCREAVNKEQNSSFEDGEI